MKKNMKKNKNANAGIALIGLVLIIVGVVIGAYALAINITERDKEFNTDIHSHIVNARYSQDPVVIKSELILAKQGMLDAGLTNDTSGRFWSWEQTPDNSMRQQYLQLDQAIGMCDMLLSMDKDTASYGAALTNLQNYIYDDNGWADEVAKSAFNLSVYSFTTIWAWVLLFFVVVVGVVFVLAGE